MNTTPNATRRVYKLFRTLKSRPGEIFPLFIDKSTPVPVGEWIPAENHPTKGYAPRPGWHAGITPDAPHLMRKDGGLPPDRVWALCEVPADVCWQRVADDNGGDVNEVPVGGNYSFQRPGRQGGTWIIAGALKVRRVLDLRELNIHRMMFHLDPIDPETRKPYNPHNRNRK